MKYLIIILLFLPHIALAKTSLYTVEAKPHLNVRSSPSINSNVVGSVSHGQAVRVREVVSELEYVSNKSGKWVRIQYDLDKFGYVFNAFLRKPSTNTYSHSMYVKGNTEYRNNKYYSAIKYYHLALENTENEVEKIKILGALSQISKVRGNIELAKGYAKKILMLDGKNSFSKSILSLNSRPVTINKPQRIVNKGYTPNTRKTYSCKERTKICLALTWGPDACSYTFNEYASRELNSTVHDIIASPSCLIGISESLNEDYSQTDIEIAMFTGVLDELGKSGVDSDNFFGNLFGSFAYIYSHAIKYSLYESCMNKCN